MQRSDGFELADPAVKVTVSLDSPPSPSPSTPSSVGFPIPPPNANRGHQVQLPMWNPLMGLPELPTDVFSYPPPPTPEPGTPHHESFHPSPTVRSLPEISTLDANAPSFRPIRGQGFRNQVSHGQDGLLNPSPPLNWIYGTPDPLGCFLEPAWDPSGPRGLSVELGRNGSGGRMQRSQRSRLRANPGRECKFCKNNGEPPESYRSHVLRNPSTGQLICNVLREHVCEVCGATGDDAHTRNYCPKVKEEKKLRYAIPVALKRTKHQSDGKLRTSDKNNNRKHQ